MSSEADPQGPPEPVMIPCAGCGVPIRSLWAPGGRGLLRGDYDLIASWLFHPKCWDALMDEHPPHQQQEDPAHA